MAGSGQLGASPRSSGSPVAVATTPPVTPVTSVAPLVATLAFMSTASCSHAVVATVATVSVELRAELLEAETEVLAGAPFFLCVNSVLSSGPNLRVGPSLLSTGEDGLGDNIYA